MGRQRSLRTATATEHHGSAIQASASALDAPRRAKPQQVRIGMVGYGYWGPHLARNLDRLPIAELAYIADLSPERRQAAGLECPGACITGDVQDVLESDVDAIVIATPIRTHYAFAMAGLQHDKHVFVEKPLAANSAQALELIDEAERRGRTIMVGHTYMYNPAVEELRRLVQSGALGRLYYVDAVRVNLGLFQPDINVMWDLAPHDLSILEYVLGMCPSRVSAHGRAHVRSHIHDLVYMTLEYPTGLLAHIQLSWLNPSKVRRFTVVGDQQMAVYDDVEANEKIRIYDHGVDAPEHTSRFSDFQLSYRYGDIVSPHIRWAEPLAVECRHFAESVMEGFTPRSDARNGLRVVRILEAADASLAADGAFVPIVYEREVASA
jgi:predicted dehydrogenase